MGQGFLGLQWETIDLSRRARLEPFLERFPQPHSGYTFATLAAWDSSFNYRFAIVDEALLTSFCLESDPHRQLLQPLGPVSEATWQLIARGAAALDYPLRLVGVSQDFLRQYPALGDRFEVREDPPAANYIYLASDLADLPGRKLQPKRNLISQASRAYSWTTEPIRPENLADCRQMIARFRQEEFPVLEGTLLQEARAFDFTLDHFAELKQQGVLLRAAGEAAGVAIFEPMAPGLAVIHFERALKRFKGAYQIVNREAAKMIRAQGFERINREEDLGDPGLRQAKLSYQPERLEMAYQLVARRPG